MADTGFDVINIALIKRLDPNQVIIIVNIRVFFVSFLVRKKLVLHK